MSPFSEDPIFVSVDKLEGCIALENAPPTREESLILTPEAYERVIKDRLESEENKEKQIKKKQKEEEKQVKEELKRKEKENSMSSKDKEK